MATANLALRFLTELAGIAAIGYAGFQIAAPVPLRVAAGFGGAVALIAAWAAIVAPNTVNGLSQPQKDLIGTGLLLLAALALAIAGQLRLGIAFAAIVIVNTVLLFLFGEGAREALSGVGR